MNLDSLVTKVKRTGSALMENVLQRVLFGVLVAVSIWLGANVIRVAGGSGLGASGPFDGWGKPAAEAASAVTGALGTTPSTDSPPKVAEPRKDKRASDPPPAGKKPAPATGGDTRPESEKSEPAASTPGTDPEGKSKGANRGNSKEQSEVMPASFEQQTVLAALCGALGATLHALGSLVAFVGNRKFVGSWSMWYLAQPLRGAVLACGVYWAWSGNLIDSKSVTWPKVGPGAMGLMFMVGLFSDLALLKLQEVFLVLFRTANNPRANPLEKPRRPVIATAKLSGTAAKPQIELGGDAFEAGDEVKVNNASQALLTQTTKTLVVALDPVLSVSGTKLSIVVHPVAKDAVDSAAATLTVP